MRKKLFMIITTLLCCGLLAACSTTSVETTTSNLPTDPRQVDPLVIQGNNQFAFELFHQLAQEDARDNVFISPFSISTALTMTANGAVGETRDILLSTLHCDQLEMATVNTSYANLLGWLQTPDYGATVNIANALWISNDHQPQVQFVTACQDYFSAPIEQFDPAKTAQTAAQINQWVAQATNNTIDKLVGEDNITAAMILNAIYFNGQWELPFDPSRTTEQDFTLVDNNLVPVQMMHIQDDFLYGESAGQQIIRLPYSNGNTAMYCILPTQRDGLDDFISRLTAESWQEMRDTMTSHQVHLALPQFKLEYGVKDLKNSLSALGMESLFVECDLSGLAEELNQIGSVLHKAFIEVDEQGTEAAAATAVALEDIALEIAEPTQFVADRPFLFLITDDASGQILFLGKVFDPSK